MRSGDRKGRAISDLFASIITLIVTVIAGAAVFGFVNAQSSASAQSYGQSVGTYVDQIKEKFVIANAAYNYPTSGKVTIWFYNYGDVDTKIMQVFIGTSPSSLSNITSDSLPLNLSKGSIAMLTVDYATASGQTYYFSILAQYGNAQTYFQKA